MSDFFPLIVDGSGTPAIKEIPSGDVLDLTGVTVKAITVDGVSSFSDGTAGAPSITNTGDTNCGLYFSAADTLAFTAGGVAQVTFADGVIAPVTTNDVDLGTSSLEFKDAYFDGTVTSDAFAGPLTGDVTGNLTGQVATAAQTNITSILATDLKIGEDDQTKVDFEDANQINFYADNTKRVTIDATGLTVNSGSLETASIDYTDGDNALNIEDGGTVAVVKNAKGTLTTDNDGSFDMSASNNFKCTPSGNFTLTFTNIVSQSGNILLVNSGGHTVAAHANTKVDASILATISTAGTYLVSYFSDGTNVYLTNSAIYT
tara:strand:+ start:17996 stop:18946 length:951 start_codon:yes stop_codon:yes gene_type:complete